MKRISLASLIWALIATAVVAEEEKVDFVKQIQPIFIEHCAKCHGAEKGQGKLHLQNAEAIQEKMKAKPEFLVAGDPEKSSLYQRLVTTDAAKRMPKKADPLPKEQIALIETWIKQGAPLSASAVDTSPEKPVAAPHETETKAPAEVAAAPKQAIDQLTSAGAQVMPMFAGSNLLWVSFAHRDKPAGDEDLALLEGVADQVDSLNLAGSKPTAAGLAPLAKLKNMSKLHLENSTATDEGLAHLSALANLEYLNLYGTEVGDVGLKHLANLKQLKNLYLWQSKASYDAAMALEKETPGLVVDLGYNHPVVVKMRLTKSLKSAKTQAETAQADLVKAEQQLATAKKNAESATARLADIEKELKALEPAKTDEKAAAGKKDDTKKDGEKKEEEAKTASAATDKDEKK
ncbi:MAG: hypothetical protein IT427_15640 [Pirellulales bacterium]|nr:hypothetical protein [Pirellulales bacterium]